MRKAMAFPVRFVAEGESVQTTTRELDETSVFVRCVEPPAQGEKIVLRLYLPGIAGADSIRAVVRESVPEGRDSGFLAEFVDLTPSVRAQIGKVLAAGPGFPASPVEPALRAGENRRLLPRYLNSFYVTVASGADRSRRQTLNLSASGVFIRTELPPEEDAIVQVVLELPDGQPPAEVQGIVLHSVKPGGEETAGAGVQFIGADDTFRTRLDAYLAKLKEGRAST
jgi:hypothetical protein